MDVTVSAGMVIMTVVLGVIAAGVAPLLTLGRLGRMDVPGTLRMVE